MPLALTARQHLLHTLQRLYEVKAVDAIDLRDELELATGEDAPMSMATIPNDEQFICGINSSIEALKDGPNQNCRQYGVKEGKYVMSASSFVIPG